MSGAGVVVIRGGVMRGGAGRRRRDRVGVGTMPAEPVTAPPARFSTLITTTPAPDIREKIERLREEARKRRNRPSQPQQ